jgi:hypothetical protein
MDDAYLFDEYARLIDAGRILIRSHFPPQVVSEYERYLGRSRTLVASARTVERGLPDVFTEYVGNPTFNAYAAKYKGSYFIAFFDGIPIVVATVVNRMLADGRLFASIGDPKAEEQDLPPLAGLAPDAAQNYNANCQPMAPKQTCRQIYAAHLCNLIFDYLAAHEMAHIVNGHASYTAFEFTVPCIMEFGTIPATTEASLESQAMELDADFTAAFPMVSMLRRIVAERDQLPEPLASRYVSPANAIYDLATAICTLFRLFGDSGITGVDLSKASHPPSRLRQMLILNAMGNYIEKRWDNALYRVAEDQFSRGVHDVEYAFQLVTAGPQQQVTGLNDVWSAHGLGYAATIANYWNSTLRPKLEDHRIATLSTYNFDEWKQ